MKTTVSMARSITWASSKQTYITARLLADRDLVDDCLRAYAYFRWADDTIDVADLSDEARSAFIARQQILIESLYRSEKPSDLCPEEKMLADLIAHDRDPDSGLRSFIRNFMAVIAFDADRQGRLVSQEELSAYTACLGTAVMDGLLYFIGNGHRYPRNSTRNLAVTGAHITHMLRDTLEDLPLGIINVPAEDIAAYGLDLDNVHNEAFRHWTRTQVEEARRCFREGMHYVDSLDVLRAKLAGVWYCARFECVLNAIERDGYRLRLEYPERHCAAAWLKMIGLGLATTFRHLASRIWKFVSHFPPQPSADTEANLSSYHLNRLHTSER